MDAFYNLHYIKGDDFEFLSKYADVFEKLWELLHRPDGLSLRMNLEIS